MEQGTGSQGNQKEKRSRSGRKAVHQTPVQDDLGQPSNLPNLERFPGTTRATFEKIQAHTIIPERSFTLDWPGNERLEEAVTSIADALTWRKLVTFSKNVNATIVKEFYANIQKEPAGIVVVRERQVPFTSASINRLFYLDDIECEFQRMKALPLEERNSIVCGPVICRPGWEPLYQPNSGALLNKIPHAHMTYQSKIWQALINGRLMPTLTRSMLTADRIVLLYCIPMKKPINVGKIIYDNIRRILADIPASLAYGSIITELCQVHGVPRLVDDIVENKGTNMGVSDIEKFGDDPVVVPQVPVVHALPAPVLTAHEIPVENIPPPAFPLEQDDAVNLGGSENPIRGHSPQFGGHDDYGHEDLNFSNLGNIRMSPYHSQPGPSEFSAQLSADVMELFEKINQKIEDGFQKMEQSQSTLSQEMIEKFQQMEQEQSRIEEKIKTLSQEVNDLRLRIVEFKAGHDVMMQEVAELQAHRVTEEEIKADAKTARRLQEDLEQSERQKQQKKKKASTITTAPRKRVPVRKSARSAQKDLGQISVPANKELINAPTPFSDPLPTPQDSAFAEPLIQENIDDEQIENDEQLIIQQLMKLSEARVSKASAEPLIQENIDDEQIENDEQLTIQQLMKLSEARVSKASAPSVEESSVAQRRIQRPKRKRINVFMDSDSEPDDAEVDKRMAMHKNYLPTIF